MQKEGLKHTSDGTESVGNVRLGSEDEDGSHE